MIMIVKEGKNVARYGDTTERMTFYVKSSWTKAGYELLPLAKYLITDDKLLNLIYSSYCYLDLILSYHMSQLLAMLLS